MRKKLLYIFLIIVCSCNKKEPLEDEPISNDESILETQRIPCKDGFAGEYPCSGYDLVTHISLADLGLTGEKLNGNDCWGWTDPETLREYVLLGSSIGTTFIDITDTEDIIVLGTLPTASSSSTWRDIKVYKNTAYIVSEATNHGMQVFDLTKLRDYENNSIKQTYTANNTFTNFSTAHNIAINEQSGYAYAVGTDTFNGGAHFINISSPLSPKDENGYAMSGYTHDAQIISYNGPDTDYVGKELFIGSNENEIVVVDVTDKSNPVEISSINYSFLGYTHQGWFTEDQRYFLVGDETDEITFGLNSRTLIFDFSDLDNPQLHFEYLGPTTAIDHNGYVKDNMFYLANYSAGVRMIDISNIENKTINEVGFFDTYPQHNRASFNGVWSVYPYFKSGNIAISDYDGGFFLIRKSE